MQNVLSCAPYLVALTIYPTSFIDCTINIFLSRNFSSNKSERNSHDISTVRISLPFKDSLAANAVRKQLCDLSHNIGPTLQPVFVSSKSGQDLKPKEIERSIVNEQSVVYYVICAMQIMSGKQPDASINALLSKKIQESVDIS